MNRFERQHRIRLLRNRAFVKEDSKERQVNI